MGNKTDPTDELVYIILSRKTPERAYQRGFELLKQRFSTWDELLKSDEQWELGLDLNKLSSTSAAAG